MTPASSFLHWTSPALPLGAALLAAASAKCSCLIISLTKDVAALAGILSKPHFSCFRLVFNEVATESLRFSKISSGSFVQVFSLASRRPLQEALLHIRHQAS